MPIAAVIRVLIFIVILAVAQLVIQFRLQAVLHEFGYGLFEQALDVFHAADVRHLQQFTDWSGRRDLLTKFPQNSNPMV